MSARTLAAAWVEEDELAGVQEPPTDDELWDLMAGLRGDPAGAADGWLDEREGVGAAPAAPEPIKAGFWDRAGGDGVGFASGGAADTMAPGAALAGLADQAWSSGLGRASDDELIGVLRAARRLASWGTALELAAIGELVNRRLAEEEAGQAGVAEHVVEEVAAALTLTARAADRVVNLAMTLERLPGTMAALTAGRIDPPRAAVIAGETAALGPADRAAVERHLLGRAEGQTTGQLRAAARRAVIAADPDAARRRKETALRDARVERWNEDAGTAALAGRDLPPARVLAADHHLTAHARALKHAGVTGSLDQLRAHVYLALLTGQPLDSLLAAAVPGATEGAGAAERGAAGLGMAGLGMAGRGAAGPGAAMTGAGTGGNGRRREPAGLTGDGEGGVVLPALAGAVNLTMPLSTWLGAGEAPGAVAGFGPLDAEDSRDVAAALAARAQSTWCITLTDAHGRPVAHGCVAAAARAGPGGGRASPAGNETSRGGAEPAPVAWTFTITPLGGDPCGHTRETAAYRPTRGLRHVLDIRHATCTFPGCRRPATQCDQDHTTPYARGGRTCECGLAPLCRRHHQAKQAHGWRLRQPQPGTLIWTTPSGRTYTTGPSRYLE